LYVRPYFAAYCFVIRVDTSRSTEGTRAALPSTITAEVPCSAPIAMRGSRERLRAQRVSSPPSKYQRSSIQAPHWPTRCGFPSGSTVTSQ
jgi:hypothetical protein